MVNEIIKVDIHGIQCDTKGCGWHDDTVPFGEYGLYLGKPCPKCGANLLTQEAHDHAVKIINRADRINRLIGWMFPKVKKYDAVIFTQYSNDVKPHGYKVEKLDK